MRLIFVNDGSTDDTLARLHALSEVAPDRVSLCDLPTNVGKGEAIRTGLQRAFELDVEYCGYWDADLATPLDVILDFCDLLDAQPNTEVIFGTRVRLLGRKIERRALRHYLGRASATVISITLGLSVYDTQCGAKLFRITPEVRSLFEEPFVSGWIFDVEVIARLIHARRAGGLPPAETVIFEQPLRAWRDVEGSKIGPRDYVRAALDLARIHRRYLRR